MPLGQGEGEIGDATGSPVDRSPAKARTPRPEKRRKPEKEVSEDEEDDEGAQGDRSEPERPEASQPVGARGTQPEERRKRREDPGRGGTGGDIDPRSSGYLLFPIRVALEVVEERYTPLYTAMRGLGTSSKARM